MKQSLKLAFLLVFVSGCDGTFNLANKIDRSMFSCCGTTIFSSPEKITMKEVHLDSGGMVGKEIIVEGSVVNVDKHFSHLVMSDESARMLVVLTQLHSVDQYLNKGTPQVLRVLGSVERGKKGLPFVQAHSIKPVENAKI